MLVLQCVRYKNFLSTGNTFTEINLQESQTTLIIGANGAGKSTILDAICYALYNKPFRRINKPQLISSINEKALLVEIEFTIGGKSYLVRRGMKPNVFDIVENGILLNRDAAARDYQEYLEKHIIKIGHKSFVQIMILGGRSYTPFMQLTTMDRRKVIEDLLDLEVFSVMHTILKEKQQENKQVIYDTDYNIRLTNEKISIQEKHIEQQRQDTEAIIAENNNKIAAYQSSIALILETIETNKQKLQEAQAELLKLGDLSKKQNDLNIVQHKLNQRLSTLNKDISFYGNHDNCPTCRQVIDQEFKCETITVKSNQVDEISNALEQLNEKQNELTVLITKATEFQSQINEFNRRINSANNNYVIESKFINDLERANRDLEHKTISETGNDDLSQLRTELEQLRKQKTVANNSRNVIELSLSIVKDGGIKSQIIKQYIPIMNKLINKYLAAMGFFVLFELNENFEESIKSRHRDNFSYYSFSDGEKARIDLAILFTWRDISKMRNSASSNLLFMDEVLDSSVDSAGVDELLAILKELSHNSNIFVISHKIDQVIDKFDRVLKVEKVKNFSVTNPLV